MSIAYRTKVNKRQIGAEQLILSEQHIVGISGAFTLTANKIRLVEVPLQEMPSTVTIPGFTEVLAAPGPFEFVVDYGIGRITFNAARSGDTVFVTYKGRGSEVDSEDVNELQIPVGTALNQNGSLVSGIVHPNNISTVITDDFLFPRNVTATAAIAGGSSLTVVTNIVTTTGNILAGGTSLSLNTAEVGSPTLDAFFTVKRGSSGDTSLKWNESIDAWEFLNDLGSPTLQIFNDGHITLSGPLELGVGSAAAPSYSFSTDPDTGMYENGANVLAFSTGGGLKWEITSSGVWFANTAFPGTVVQANDGTLALPSYGFSTQGGVGMYRIGSNHLGFVTNSLLQLDISTSLISTQIPISVLTSVGGTSATFSDSTNSTLRIEHPASNVLTFDVNASNYFKFSVASTEIARLTSSQALFTSGTVIAPGISFLSEPGTGISRPFTNVLSFSVDTVVGNEVARFFPSSLTSTAGDFVIKEGGKIGMDGVGNAFLRFTSASAMYGQTDSITGNFSFGSNNALTLFANSIVGEPTLSMLTNGSITVKNSTQGFASDRTFKLEMSQQFGSGYHRTFELFPSDANLGTTATGTVTVVDYTMLSGAVLTVNGVTLTEGLQWVASVNNNTTASSLASAISLSGVATGAAIANVITITANTPGIDGNSITLATSDPVNLTISGATLSGGTDDFVIALGYHANGTTIDAASIDVHNSLPLVVTINDSEVVRITSSLMTIDEAVDVTTHQIHNVVDPTSNQDAATKFYVDSVAAGFDPKASCRVATTANLTATASGSGVGKTLTNSGTQAALVIDGISMVVTNRVLVKDQTTASNNGIYTVTNIGSVSTNWVLTRATDFDGSPSNEVSGGNFSFVEAGTLNAGIGWVVVWSGNIVVDTDPINWTQFSNPATKFLVDQTPITGNPTSPTLGQVWFNPITNQFMGYNGTSMVILG